MFTIRVRWSGGVRGFMVRVGIGWFVCAILVLLEQHCDHQLLCGIHAPNHPLNEDIPTFTEESTPISGQQRCATCSEILRLKP